jgi:hypothetical protein
MTEQFSSQKGFFLDLYQFLCYKTYISHQIKGEKEKRTLEDTL